MMWVVKAELWFRSDGVQSGKLFGGRNIVI